MLLATSLYDIGNIRLAFSFSLVYLKEFLDGLRFLDFVRDILSRRKIDVSIEHFYVKTAMHRSNFCFSGKLILFMR